MSRRSRGFSLLEVQVGLLLLTLIVVGFTRLVGAQESLVRDLEAWCRNEPVFVVTPPADEHERVARMPAALVARDDENGDAIGEGWLGAETTSKESETLSWANELCITLVSRDLEPQQAQAVLDVVPIAGAADEHEEPDAEDDDKDKDKDDDDEEDD